MTRDSLHHFCHEAYDCKDLLPTPTQSITAMSYLHHASFGIGVLGVFVIVFGVLTGLVRKIR